MTFTIKIHAPEIVAELKTLNATIDKIFKLLRHPAAPVGLRFSLFQEVGMKLRYRFTADPPKAADVVKRTLTINGNATEFGGQTVDFGTADFNKEESVTVSLVDTDDSGNSSDPLTATFTAHDTIAPGAPTGMGVKLESEVSDEPVTDSTPADASAASA